MCQLRRQSLQRSHTGCARGVLHLETPHTVKQVTLQKRRYIAVWRTAIRVLALALACASAWPASARADTEYYRHSFFDNSLTPDVYYYSLGKASAPSALVLVNGKLPVETKTFLTPPNALRLEWKSAADGGWEAQVDVMRFRNREISFRGDALFFSCFSPEGMAAAALPAIRVLDAGRNFSAPLRLGRFAADLPAGKWVHLKIPLSSFRTSSIHALDA